MDNPVRLHWLDPHDPEQRFPPLHLAMREPNGLLAIGGDLSLTRLIRAYSQGIFPWYNPDEPILWWSPDPRAILVPEHLKVSRSMAKRLKKNDYAVTLDAAYAQVLDGCAAPRGPGQGTWLGADMKAAYQQMYRHGYSHSLEVWREGRLIGGLYGVSVGRMFFGESMFSRQTDASKIGFYWLCRQLQTWRFKLIDCQIASAHLRTLGAVEISRERFARALHDAASMPGRTGLWRFDIAVPCPREHLPAVF